MARTFLLSLIVALLLVFALTEASRGQTNQTDGQKITNRGTARYNSKSTTESSSLPTPEIRLPRDKSSRSETVANLEKHETHFAREGSIRSRSKLKQSQAADDSTTTSRTSSRHLNTSVDNSRNRQKSHATQALKEEITRDDNKENAPESRTPKRLTASRRTSSDESLIWVDNVKLDHEVFTKSNHLRSRTGRKISVNHGRESKSEIIPIKKSPENENVEKAKSPSKESEKEEARLEHSKIENVTPKANISKKIDTKSTNNSGSHKDQAKDVLLSGSESVRVDVPLTDGNDEDINLLTSATVSSVSVSPRQVSRSDREKVENNDIATRSNTKKSRQSSRSKSRNRSKTRDPNLEAANSGSISRRGSSRSSNTVTAEMNRRSSNSRHRSNSKNVNSRGRSTHQSRDAVTAEARNSDRQRNIDTDSETNANRRMDTRRNDRRTSEGKRRSKDNRSKAEVKVDEQDIRVQSRSRSRAATSNLDVTTTYVPKATIAETTTVPSVNAEITTSSSTTTIRPSTTIRTSTPTERVSRNRGRDRGESSRAIKPPKEDFFNHGLGFRGRKTSTETSSSIVTEPRTTTPKSETQLRGNPGWTLRRRPGHVNQDTPSSTTSTPSNRDQTNEIVLSTDSPRSTETPSTNAGRRGTKRPKVKDESDIASGVAAKSTTRGRKTFNKSENFDLPKGTEPESDNYPPAFRARLSQLKNSNSKPTEGKSTTRTSLQATKPSLTSLFSERSKLKLELARRLIKPELNVDENDFDVTTTAYSGKSKAKEVSTVSESRNIEKTTKATSKLIGTHATHGSSTIASAPEEKSTVRGRWKILETRKSTKDRNVKSSLRSPAGTTKKIRVTSERASSFVEKTSKNVTELNAIPRLITVSHRGAIPVEGTAATAVDTTKVQSPTSTMASRDEVSTLTNTVEAIEENTIITTVEPLKPDKTFIETITATSGAVTDASTESKVLTEFPQEVTLPPTVITANDILSSSTLSTLEKVYPVYIPNANDLSSDKEKTTILNDSTKGSVRSRYTSQEQPDKVTVSMVTSRTVGPTSRYIRKKSGVFTPYDSIPKTSNTEATLTQTKRREFRPRTSTYRRHSEVPTSQLVIQPPTTVEQTTAGVAITPKPTKYHAQVEPSTRSLPFSRSSLDPLVSVRIDTSNDTISRASDIAGSSNGNSGNSNIFNPTRSTYLTANTTTLLEQLRSTVAPLLNNLSDKTPIFSGAYSNVNTGNSAPRITPNGSPPRFSARYKGAELLVRKPSVGQAVVPSITTSSTTASTLIENSGSAPPVTINSPGEPRFITFYQALESASIRNENLGAEDVSQRQRLTGVVTKVDPNATVPNGASNDIANNNDTIAPSITATTTTTSSPDITTVDTTTAVQSANNSLASILGAESSTDGSPETTTTVQTPANPDINGGETTPVPTSETPGSETTVPVNTITNTPPSTTTETATSTSIADITLAAESSTESVPNDVQSTELSTKTTEIAMLPITETVNAIVSMPASQNLQTVNDISDTTIPSSITKSVTVIHLPEATTILAMNDMSESIETNTVQQSEETTPRLTETTSIIIEDIETNTIQQSDTTNPSQTMEITSTAESTTTEEISNDVIEIRTTAIPAFSTTYRTRLVDYAQDILSFLSQKGVTTINTPIQKPIATTTVSPELSNAIPDSSSTNTESPAQPEETTTIRIAGPGTDETTESFDVEFVSITTDGSEETNRNTVGVNTMLQGQSNDQGINAQNTLNSNTATEQTFSRTVGNERNTASDPESTTTAGEVATTTMTPTSRLVESVTENGSRSSNDTLLAELMTIAKTLFTEAMNDTRQLGQTDGTVGNDRNRTVFMLNVTSEATTAPSELSKPLENTTERIDVTTLIDLSGNERGDNSTRGPVVGSNILLVESNARPIDVGDVITMSLSQMKTGISNITTVTASMNSELTTNTPDSQLSNPIESSSNNTEQQTITTVSNNETQLLNRLLEFATNNPLASSVTANTEGMLSTFDVNNSTTSDMVTELTTSVAMTEINVVQTNAVDTTNQTPIPTMIMPASDLQVTNDQSLIANASDITTTLPMVSDTSNTQPFDTEPPITESVRNLVGFTDTTTNQLNDITTNAPQMLTDLVSEMPNFIARLQDTTSTTTAQGTAGSRIIQPEQTTETIITTTTIVPNITTSSTASTTDSTTSPVSSINASTNPSSSIESIATTTTETTTTTMTTSTEALSRSELTTTVESTSEMTTTTADINDNLVSTETTTDTSTTRGTTVVPTESEDLNMISRINDGEETTTTTTTTSVASPTNGTNNTSTTTTTSTTARTTVLNRVSPFPASTPFQPGPYLGRFGGSQMTPLPRPSSSKAPVRDYLIYGIYPNKTIVRKRPEDNVIDGRNVDSPYVIFGIFPDGRLVRKFPNGTIIPDSPRNPVEVVFTLRTTTTTNRPAPRPYYNQANQAGVYNNQYQVPVYYSNGRPMDDLTRGAQSPGSFDFGLIGNAIGVTPGGPNFTGPFGPPASVPSTNKMNDILLNSQMGTLPNSFGNQRPSSSQVQGPPRIIQDRERNEASRTRVTSGQNSAVYIGQDKFINYQIDGAPDINPKVVDVRINSVATSVNEGTASSTSSNPSFENLLNNQSGGNIITAPPGFPWRDPLDQIFGITTNSPMQTASVASNQLDEPIGNNAPIVSRVNSMVEVFTPIVSTAVTSPSPITTTTASTTTLTTATASTTTPTTTTSTTTPTTTSTTTPTTTTASTTTPTTTTTTTSTTTPTTTSTTTTPAPTTTPTTTTAATTTTTTTTTTSTTTPATTTSQTTTPARIGSVPPSTTASTISTNNILSRLQTNTVENPFGSTYGDLAFLNSLLQNNNDVKSTTPKTLSEVEQLLANRILSLALANPGPTRSPKAIQTANSNANVNVIKNPSKSTSFELSSEPIIIDLLPSSVSSSTSSTKKYTETPASTKAPVVITAKPKTTARPKATTPRASVGFGSGLWRALFGNNFFDATTVASAVKRKPTTKATQKPASSTQAPAQIIKSTLTNHVMTSIKSPTTPRNIDISDIHVASSTSLADNIISASTPTISTTLLNNPRLRDVSTSKYSSEDDAKFLAALLQAVQTETRTSTSATTRLSEDDEAFLRAILNNQASISTTTSSSNEVNPAALLALLLKQQGIEPTTPATKLREQLQLSSQGLLTPDATSTTTRPTTTRPITIPKQVVTSRPSARPRPTENILQTTTWAPSSTYPPPLFGGTGSGSGLVTATRAIGRFLGAAISGAAQQLQSLLRNSTRSAAG